MVRRDAVADAVTSVLGDAVGVASVSHTRSIIVDMSSLSGAAMGLLRHRASTAAEFRGADSRGGDDHALEVFLLATADGAVHVVETAFVVTVVPDSEQLEVALKCVLLASLTLPAAAATPPVPLVTVPDAHTAATSSEAPVDAHATSTPCASFLLLRGCRAVVVSWGSKLHLLRLHGRLARFPRAGAELTDDLGADVDSVQLLRAPDAIAHVCNMRGVYDADQDAVAVISSSPPCISVSDACLTIGHTASHRVWCGSPAGFSLAGEADCSAQYSNAIAFHSSRRRRSRVLLLCTNVARNGVVLAIRESGRFQRRRFVLVLHCACSTSLAC
jgi:hypothetical protein